MKHVYLLGYPVAHSISPDMQSAAFQACGLEWQYQKLGVLPEQLSAMVGALRAADCAGANVTIPHKREIVPLLDQISPEATEIGAVNTIVNIDGHLTGENTDAIGFLQSLQAEGIQLRDRRAFVIGAGGAAAAVCYALARERVSELVLVNRTVERAEALAARVRESFSNLDILVNRWVQLDQVDLVINATAIGMATAVDESPISGKTLPRGAVAIDLVYNPTETRFLREARQAGARCIGGLGMLVYQGARSFELWTGQAAPVEIMRSAAEQALAGMPNQIDMVRN